ncbi:MAG: topoisomerase DNA-binding C4 zinc finger domain-containing protein [Bacteroidales bacterium]|nr:topoisomerase DNA-binding C4 zinc finger domain-containing protein [Bacteroidales bacterium]
MLAGRCPRCSGGLVLRNGRYGKFYGCSNFPRCRYAADDKRN